MNLVAFITSSFRPSVDLVMESNATYNGTGSPNNSTHSPEDDAYSARWTAVYIFIILVSLFGMVANGMVIWILGFRMKKNYFSTYIFNLSIADFAFPAALVPDSLCWILMSSKYIQYLEVLNQLLSRLCILTFSASQYLLAAISIDRCVCLFFPLWHKCHRPPHLSTTVCVTIWILTIPFSAIDFALAVTIRYDKLWLWQLLLNAVLCMPAMVISTIAMLIKVCCISPQFERRKFLSATLSALLFFLFFAFPLNTAILFLIYDAPIFSYFYLYALIGASLNSAMNPVIYFLVGRNKKAQYRGRITKIFEKLFQEEESCKDNVESSLETHL